MPVLPAPDLIAVAVSGALHLRFMAAQQNHLDETPIDGGMNKEIEMIIWSGWGAAIVLAGAILGGVVAALFGAINASAVVYSIGIFVGGLAGAAVIHLLARRIESAPGRTLVDQASGQTLIWKKSAGSVFFIPTRYWPYIIAIVFAAVAVMEFADPAAFNSFRS